jgi:isopentenyl-diphosphate delta-isomerase
VKPKNDRVKLTSGLSFTTDCGHNGIITQLSGERLYAALDKIEHSALLSKEQLVALKVSLSQDQVFSFSGKFAPHKGDLYEFQLSEDGSQVDALRDLLGQIRKDQHISLCADEDVESSDKFTGFERIQFVPEALPELDLDDIDTKVSFLGRQFDYPIWITGMTGGVSRGTMINQRLALAAATHNIPMGIGSQRLGLDNPAYAEIFDVKRFRPDIFLIGNLGMAQLLASNYLDICKRAVDMISADALAIHLNVIQEAVQVEGDRHFKHTLKRIESVCASSNVPIVVKEVGSGMSADTAKRLLDAGVAAIDVGGRGGTSWGYIEGLRGVTDDTLELGQIFRNWGIPTAYSLSAVKQVAGKTPIIATGGIRDGLTVAKAVALGATFAGIGLPLMRAALSHESGPSEVVERLIRGLKITMLGSGARSLRDLKHRICLGHPLEKTFESVVHQQSLQN